jgi:hypothetical protein
LGLATCAQAKTCEEVKAAIATDLDKAGVHGYSLQIVAAGTPLAGAQVVGNCAGGSRKVAYRRYALQQAQFLVSETPVPQSPEPLPKPALSDPRPDPKPVAAPTAAARRPLAPELVPAVAVPQPASAPPSGSTQAEAALPPQTQEQTPVVKPSMPEAVLTGQATAAQPAMATHWIWLAGLIVLPLLLVWAWRRREGGLDAAGLPRGPRL